MTIDEAINVLRWLNPPRANKNSFDNFVEAIEMAIDALEKQRWIPVSERLPEESGDYLVTRYAGYAPDLIIIDIARYEPGEWHKAYPVTAWMPLPEPYQKRGDQDGMEK